MLYHISSPVENEILVFMQLLHYNEGNCETTTEAL